MGKYYAVRRGKEPGIYESWDECKKQVIGFPGAEYAGFETYDDAEIFMNSEKLDNESINIDEIETYSFVDGSFNPKTNTYGYGGFLINGNDKYTLQGSGTEPDMIVMRNISGEILGSVAAIKKAIELGLTEITIFYDYIGIEMWAKGMWKRNKSGTQEYYNYIQSVKDEIVIHFVKVKGHSGIEGNEEADKLAKESVGIET